MALGRQILDRPLDAAANAVAGLPHAATGDAAERHDDVVSQVAAEATARAAADAAEAAARAAGDTNAISVSETFATNADAALLASIRQPKFGEFWVYTLDYDGTGNDSTGVPGISSSSMSAALAAATPLKTFEKLGQILPHTGNGATLVILAKPRTAGATYKKIDGTTDQDGSWLNGLEDWHFLGRGSLDFANDTNDKIRAGFLTVSGTNAPGYNPTAGATVNTIPCQKAGGGAASLPAESGGFSSITGYRIRFSATTATTALQNACAGIYKNTTSQIVLMDDLPATPTTSDVFVIEGPGVTFGSLSFNAGWNRAFSLVGFNATGASAITAPSPVTRISGLVIAGAFSESFNEQFVSIRSYVDEADATITVGFGYRAAASVLLSSSKALTVSSSSWLGPRLSTAISVAPSRSVGAGSVCVSGVSDFATSGPGLCTYGNLDLAGTATARKLRISAPVAPAMQLGGLGANVFGVDVSNCSTSVGNGIFLINSSSSATKTGPGMWLFNDCVSTDGNNTSGSVSLLLAVLALLDVKYRDGTTVYWGSLKSGSNTITADRDILTDGSASGRFADLAIQNLQIAGIRVYGTDPAVGTYFNHLGNGPSTICELHDAGFFHEGPFPPFRIYQLLGYADGPGTAPLSMPAQADVLANCSAIAGVSCNYIYIAGDLASIIQGGPAYIEFVAGSFPSGVFTAGSIAYLSELGGSDTGKARVGPPSTGIAIPLGPIQAVSGNFGLVNLTAAASSFVAAAGHASESALVSIAGTVVDVPLTASTVLGRGSSGDVVAVPFSTIAGTGSAITATTGDVVATGPGSVSATIQAGVVTNAKLATVPTATLKGRSAAGTGPPSDLTAAAVKTLLAISFADVSGTVAAGQFPALTGDVTTPGGSLATTIANGAVTNVKRANMAASTLSGNATGSPAAPTDLTAAAVKTLLAISFADVTGTVQAAQFPALTGDVTTTAGSFATTLANLPQSVLLTRTGALTAALPMNAQKITGLADPSNPQDAATKHYVDASFSGGVPLVDGDKGDVVVSSSGAVWTVDTDVVTFAKMQNIPTQTLVGRQTAGTGDPESIGVTGGVEFDGSGNIRRAALTGDVSASAGSAGTVINPNVVTNSQLAQVPTGTLKGRTAAGTGNTSDLTLAAVKAALAIVFADITGTLQAAQFPALTGDVTTVAGSLVTTLAASGVGAGTYGDASHVAQVTVDAKGRVTAASSPSISITAGAVSGLSTTQTGALTGDVTKPAGSGATTLANIPNDAPMAGDVLATQIADPAAPAAGKTRIYASSADPVFKAIAAGGVVTHTVRSHAAVAHQFLIEVTDDGNTAGAQPAVGDLQAVAALTTLANPTGGTAAPIAATVAQMRTMLGLDAPQHFDLLLSYGIGNGSNGDSLTPQSAGPGNWAFFLLPTTRNSDIPNNLYIGGNTDANLNSPEGVNDWAVIGSYGHAQLIVNIRSVTGLGTSTMFFVLSKNGLVDGYSSVIGATITATGGPVYDTGVIAIGGALAFSTDDRIGVRAQVLGGAVGVQLRAHVTVHLTP